MLVLLTHQKDEVNYLYRSISKVDLASKVCTMNMAVKRSRIELSHHKYLVYTTVEAVTHRDIDKPVTSSNRNLSSAPNKKIRYQNIWTKKPSKKF
jgi:ribosomal protein L9